MASDGFYEEIFEHLKMPHQPVRWEPDRSVAAPRLGARGTPEIAKEAAVIQLINAYRVRGHLIADLDPLGGEPSYHPELDPDDLWADHLGPGSRISHRQPGRGDRRGRPKAWPPCARSWKPCARPIAARSAAST